MYLQLKRLEKPEPRFIRDAVITCAGCGREFGAVSNRAKYCDDACRAKIQSRFRIRKIETRICIRCGDEFFARSDTSTMHCSAACGGKTSREEVEHLMEEIEMD